MAKLALELLYNGHNNYDVGYSILIFILNMYKMPQAHTVKLDYLIALEVQLLT